jgi:hypothetical protein
MGLADVSYAFVAITAIPADYADDSTDGHYCS